MGGFGPLSSLYFGGDSATAAAGGAAAAGGMNRDLGAVGAPPRSPKLDPLFGSSAFPTAGDLQQFTGGMMPGVGPIPGMPNGILGNHNFAADDSRAALPQGSTTSKKPMSPGAGSPGHRVIRSADSGRALLASPRPNLADGVSSSPRSAAAVAGARTASPLIGSKPGSPLISMWSPGQASSHHPTDAATSATGMPSTGSMNFDRFDQMPTAVASPGPARNTSAGFSGRQDVSVKPGLGGLNHLSPLPGVSIVGSPSSPAMGPSPTGVKS